MTHTGMIIGIGMLYPGGPTQLRETKNFWVTPKGTKWSKRNGFEPGVEWPRQHLDLTSIKPLA